MLIFEDSFIIITKTKKPVANAIMVNVQLKKQNRNFFISFQNNGIVEYSSFGNFIKTSLPNFIKYFPYGNIIYKCVDNIMFD